MTGGAEWLPSGCTYCGLPERDHFQRWSSPHGWHAWTRPTDAQTKRRMLARRAERARDLLARPTGPYRPTEGDTDA